MTSRNLDLWITMILAATGLAAQLGPVPAPVHLIGGLLLVLACPGYALVAALFPGGSLSRLHQALFSIGLSIVVAILGAIVFSGLPWWLRAGVWTGLCFSVSVIASIIALSRRDSTPATKPVASKRPAHAMRIEQWVLLGAAALVAIAAVVLVQTPRPATGVLGYTQLWMLPDGSNTGSVKLGVTSSELANTGYQLQVTFNGQPLQEPLAFNLAPGESWQGQLTVPHTAGDGLVEAMLYRVATPDSIYRHVTLWHSKQ